MPPEDRQRNTEPRPKKVIKKLIIYNSDSIGEEDFNDCKFLSFVTFYLRFQRSKKKKAA